MLAGFMTANRKLDRLTLASSFGCSKRDAKFSYPSWFWYPAFLHSAIVSPWKMSMWKKVSRRRI
jgi:hypothetical protein